MNIAIGSDLPCCYTLEKSVCGRSLKRRLRPSQRPSQVSFCSPLMSRPPSPARRPSDDDIPPSSSAQQVQTPPVTSSVSSTASPMPSVAVHHSLAPSFYERIGPGHPPTLSQPPFRRLRNLPPLSNAQFQLPSSTVQSTTLVQPIVAAPQGFRPATTKTGRKSKAHVASACINCKKAHLSCDENRPCARCVASGKQVTCIDVQHKKRGRPRLREDSDFKVERMIPEAGPAVAGTIASSDPRATRPIIATRSARADSFRSQRSLRSQGSDTSSGLGASPMYPYPPPLSTTRTSLDSQRFHPPPAVPSEFEVPTAYLDLDFTILKANAPYKQIVGQEVVGQNLGDILRPADGESFLTIRNRLRREREAREPAYMAPIIQAGQDALHLVTEADVERYTQGSYDHTYMWTQQAQQTGAQAQTFPARVRLAKASIYFVAVTLPSFRPMNVDRPSAVATYSPPSSLRPGPTLPVPPATAHSSSSESYSSMSQAPVQSIWQQQQQPQQPQQLQQRSSPYLTRRLSMSGPATFPPPLPPPPTAGQFPPGARTYPPPYQYPSYQDQHASSFSFPHQSPTPRSSISEPSFEPRPFVHAPPAPLTTLPATGLQLAPIAQSPSSLPSPSVLTTMTMGSASEGGNTAGTIGSQANPTQQYSSQQQPLVSSMGREGSDSLSGSEPRKRSRRMGIDDVLQ